jgi:signal transduction histidine kinase
VLLGFIYWSTVSYMSSQTDNTIEIDILDLTERYQHAGLAGLTQLIDERLARRPAGASVYLLTDKDLAPLTGNLDSWPVNADIRGGWLEFDLKHSLDSQPHRARARLFRLAGGFLLLVGRDIHEFEITRRRISMSLVWALGIMLLLGGAGSVMMGRSTLQRIEAINQASREIMSGDLSRRIPSRHTGDDFDTLADNLNNMLEQIESLMESVRRVSDNIAHDLRTPLARLRNRLEELHLDGTAADAPDSALTQALQEADALLNTFNALLRIARIEAQDDSAHFTAVDIGALINDVMELYEPLAEDKQLHFESAIHTSLVFNGDRDLLFQALANLLDNAIKYTPAAGSIRLTLENEDDQVCLRLCDSGPGIPESQREKVFQRFFRLEQSRSPPGNGLGMSLVKAVAQRHHLDLQLQDNDPGLCVCIRFPRLAGA